jgi:hypothetical protein
MSEPARRRLFIASVSCDIATDEVRIVTRRMQLDHSALFSTKPSFKNREFASIGPGQGVLHAYAMVEPVMQPDAASTSCYSRATSPIKHKYFSRSITSTVEQVFNRIWGLLGFASLDRPCLPLVVSRA